MQRYDHNRKGALADTPHSCLDFIFIYHRCFFIIIFHYTLQSSTHIILSLETLWETVQQHFSPANRITIHHNYRMMVSIKYV